MIKITPFEIEDMKEIDIRDQFTDEGDFFEAARNVKNNLNTMAYTLRNDEGVLGIFVLQKIWGKAATLTAITSKLVEKYPKTFHKYSKALLVTSEIELGVERTQCTVKADFSQAVRWAERLGFVNEGLMRKFGPSGKDYYMFARVKWDH